MPDTSASAGSLRQVVGQRTRLITAAEFAQLRAGRPLLLDVGTGDGRHVQRMARARPDWLVAGIDAVPAQLARSSAAAARKPARGGLPNALFAWAAAEDLPAALGLADELHVLMPWGSLLRGMLGLAPQVLQSLRARAAPHAALLATLNLHAWRPPVAEVAGTPEPTPESAPATLGRPYQQAGWRIDRYWYPGPQDRAELATSWGGRLGASRRQLDILAISARATAAAAAAGQACGGSC
jgi:16S rRNA (adenine(1408)-N(1))-methyltransferase